MPKGFDLLGLKRIVQVDDHVGESLPGHREGTAHALAVDKVDVGKIGRGRQQMDPAGMANKKLIEHATVDPGHMLAQVGNRVGRLEAQHRRQITGRQSQVDQAALLVLFCQDGADVHGHRTGATSAARRQHRDHFAGLPCFGRRSPLGFHSDQRGAELSVDLILVEILIGPSVQSPKDQLGVGRRPDGQQTGLANRVARVAQRGQSRVGIGR